MPSKPILFADALIGMDVLRVVLQGAPSLSATTPSEALAELRESHDAFRQFVVAPPRGHQGVNACILLPPFSPGTVATAVIAGQFGYAALAGTPLIAAATALIETGRAPAQSNTAMFFDTAKGRQTILPVIDNGLVSSARWETLPPKILRAEAPLTLADGRTAHASLISTGLPYAVVRAAELGISLEDEPAVAKAGIALGAAALSALSLADLGRTPDLDSYVTLVIGDLVASDPPRLPVAWVSARGIVASSPGGSGALAAAAHLHQTGELPLGTSLEAVASGATLRCGLTEEGGWVAAQTPLIAKGELL
ncbi:MAG: proline racemase family protein [Pseudomonadota bacterium]